MAEKIDQATQTMIANLEKNTGKSLADWVKLVQKLGAAKHGEVIAHLKTEHGLGHGYANLVAHSAKGPAPGTLVAPGDDAVEAQYAGEKAALRPVYERIAAAVKAFGGDVALDPKKAYVSLRRNKQFALVQPSTKSRLDVGIQLKGVEAKGRLEASGSWNTMVSHRVRLESAGDVDAELIGWLKQAYDKA